MNEYYNTIAGEQSHSDNSYEHSSPPSNNDTPPISIGQVKAVLKNINTSKAVISDDYPAWISKQFSEDLCVPVARIVNLALQTCRYPSLYKTAEITPIAKTPSPVLCKDYRPISLLWHIGKVIESFMNRQLQKELSTKLDRNQFAYRQGVGCTDALVCMLDDVTKALDNTNNIGTQLILYDFSKAFDLMDHKLLLSKLSDLDFSPPTISLVANYLNNRSHCVLLRGNNVKSEYRTSNIGVPQGTLCGPTLWLAFVNSLAFSSGNAIKYADDTTAYYPLSKSATTTTTNTKTEVKFEPPDIGQTLIDECQEWAIQNKMRLNAEKTKCLNIALKKTITMNNPLSMNDQHQVELVTNAKLLVVTLDSHLSFSEHITAIRKSASKKIHGLLVLKQSGVDQTSLTHLYQSRIIPTISHASPAWYPFITDHQKEELEKTQRLALRIIYSDEEHYCDRLAAANITTLCETLNQHCHQYTSKIKNNPDHLLRHRLIERTVSRPKRSTAKLSDFYIKKSRTVKRSLAILCNPSYI